MLRIVPTTRADADAESQVQLNRKRFQLANLLRCTEDILICAQNADWESVESMEQARQKEIIACFSDSHLDSSPLIAEALATLIHMNQQITELVKLAKTDLVRNHQQLMSRNGIAREYQALMRGLSE